MKITIDNSEHFEIMKRLVSEGTNLRRIINYYQSPSDTAQLAIKSEAFEKYHAIVQELHALPEELERKWTGAKQRLIENKIYPYNK